MSSRDEHAGLILLVEDNRQIAEMVGEFLERRGYSVDFAQDGVSGLHLAVSNSYDVVVLDLMLPGIDGLDVCRKLRGDAKKSTPVLMLTASDTLEDKLVGLEAGADDYLVKPFEVRELEARLRALIRRDRRQVSSEVLTVGDMTLDTATLRLTRSGQELTVSPIGLKLLAILMRESPRVVSRRDIEREIWGDTLPDSDTLRSHLYNLRRVIDKPFEHAAAAHDSLGRLPTCRSGCGSNRNKPHRLTAQPIQFMTMRGVPTQRAAHARGGLQRRLMLIFGMQLVAVVVACLMGFYDVAPAGAVLLLIVIVSALAWLAAQRVWRPVSALARVIGSWDEGRGDLDALQADRLANRVPMATWRRWCVDSMLLPAASPAITSANATSPATPAMNYAARSP